MPRKVLVLLADGFEEVETATPVDVLRRAGAAVTVAAIGGLERTGARGMVYKADILIDGAGSDYDMLVIPGGMPGAKNIGENAAARDIACALDKAGKFVCAICAAPVMTLGKWGLLDSRAATCYPGMESMFPQGVRFSAERVVVDGNVTTSRGPGTALEFSLILAAHLYGSEVADKVADAMLAPGR